MIFYLTDGKLNDFSKLMPSIAGTTYITIIVNSYCCCLVLEKRKCVEDTGAFTVVRLGGVFFFVAR